MSTSEIDVMSASAPEHEGFEVVEWDIRPSSAGTNPDAELDNGCGCGCGCD